MYMCYNYVDMHIENKRIIIQLIFHVISKVAMVFPLYRVGTPLPFHNF